MAQLILQPNLAVMWKVVQKADTTWLIPMENPYNNVGGNGQELAERKGLVDNVGVESLGGKASHLGGNNWQDKNYVTSSVILGSGGEKSEYDSGRNQKIGCEFLEPWLQEARRHKQREFEYVYELFNSRRRELKECWRKSDGYEIFLKSVEKFYDKRLPWGFMWQSEKPETWLEKPEIKPQEEECEGWGQNSTGWTSQEPTWGDPVSTDKPDEEPKSDQVVEPKIEEEREEKIEEPTESVEEEFSFQNLSKDLEKTSMSVHDKVENENFRNTKEFGRVEKEREVYVSLKEKEVGKFQEEFDVHQILSEMQDEDYKGNANFLNGVQSLYFLITNQPYSEWEVDEEVAVIPVCKWPKVVLYGWNPERMVEMCKEKKLGYRFLGWTETKKLLGCYLFGTHCGAGCTRPREDGSEFESDGESWGFAEKFWHMVENGEEKERLAFFRTCKFSVVEIAKLPTLDTSRICTLSLCDSKTKTMLVCDGNDNDGKLVVNGSSVVRWKKVKKRLKCLWWKESCSNNCKYSSLSSPAETKGAAGSVHSVRANEAEQK